MGFVLVAVGDVVQAILLEDAEVDLFEEVAEFGVWSAVDGEVGGGRGVAAQLFELFGR